MKVGERSIITFTKYKRAVTAGASDSSQSVLTPLALLIPSIQPHHYGNWMSHPPRLTSAIQLHLTLGL